MYLVDTNVWLERLLGQERSEEVAHFLSSMPSDHLFITDSAFHSISVILNRFGEVNTDTEFIVQAIGKFKLDYDDAYQYIAAEKYDLVIVSFDADFDRTIRGRKSPKEVLES